MTRTADVLWIADDVLSEMRVLATHRAPLETGGVLLGYIAANQTAVVTAHIGPGPRAKHGKLRFTPDYDYQQTELEAHFARSEGRETYLGDWHTHPSGECALSRQDKRVLARIGRTPSSRTVRPIMVVLAGGDQQWRACAARLRLFQTNWLRRPEVVELAVETFVREGPTDPFSLSC